MIATENLKDEHKGINLMLNIMEGICKKLQKGEKVDTSHLDSILEFLQVFVDKCHHTKEEDILFPAILQTEQGSTLQDSIDILNKEHTKGRRAVKNISNAILEYKKGRADTLEMEENILKYAHHLRKHIDKENYFFFPIADIILNLEVQKELFKEFDIIEVEKIGVGKHDEFHHLLDTLEKIYL